MQMESHLWEYVETDWYTTTTKDVQKPNLALIVDWVQYTMYWYVRTCTYDKDINILREKYINRQYSSYKLSST